MEVRAGYHCVLSSPLLTNRIGNNYAVCVMCQDDRLIFCNGFIRDHHVKVKQKQKQNVFVIPRAGADPGIFEKEFLPLILVSKEEGVPLSK